MSDSNQMYQQAGPYFAQNIGGYPCGYPPVSSQNNGQMFPPGVGVPLEVTYTNGATVTIPPQYVQGGTLISQGGFNPISNTISQPTAMPGFNPYAQAMMNNNVGFSPYDPAMYQQQMTPNYTLQDLLYDENPTIVTTGPSIFQDLLPTDQEQAKMGTMNNYFANSPWQENIRRQKQVEETRRNIQESNVMIAKLCHWYATGEELDEAAAMKFYDPLRSQIDYASANPEERKNLRQMRNLNNSQAIYTRMVQANDPNGPIYKQREAIKTQILESQNKLLGVVPGEEYGLKKFLDNGYKILIDIDNKKARRLNRNGTRHYSRNNYRAHLSQYGNSPVPVHSKDDEYFSSEEALKAIYDRNKINSQSLGVIRGQDGNLHYVPSEESGSEYERHKQFLEEIQRMKVEDDAHRR